MATITTGILLLQVMVNTVVATHQDTLLQVTSVQLVGIYQLEEMLQQSLVY